jgi:hypothetical protein
MELGTESSSFSRASMAQVLNNTKLKLKDNTKLKLKLRACI